MSEAWRFEGAGVSAAEVGTDALEADVLRYCRRTRRTEGLPGRKHMAAQRGSGGNVGGIGLGGILVIVGIIVMLVWSLVLGLIITLVGLVAFGGFAKGKWY
jgi:hypothetical protein